MSTFAFILDIFIPHVQTILKGVVGVHDFVLQVINIFDSNLLLDFEHRTKICPAFIFSFQVNQNFVSRGGRSQSPVSEQHIIKLIDRRFLNSQEKAVIMLSSFGHGTMGINLKVESQPSL